jgi:hypothetical protein
MRSTDRAKLLDVIFNAQYDDITVPQQAAEVVAALTRQNLSVQALRLFRDEFLKSLAPHVD